MVSVTGTVVGQTERAVNFLPDTRIGDKPCWLPKSQIVIERLEWADRIILPIWLATKAGFYP
jgi:hypothetical protein